MKNSVKILLSLLLVFALISNLSAIADFVKEPSNKTNRSVSSVKKPGKKGKSGSKSKAGAKVSVLSIVKGTVTLLAPKKFSGSLKSIYQGNSNKVSSKKAIKVTGSLNDGTLKLKGKGASGKGYTISLGYPRSINRLGKFKTSIGSVTVKYKDATANFTIDKLTGQRKKKSGVLKATFSTRISSRSKDKAKGRFVLRLTN